jgi:hypothetical protein
MNNKILLTGLVLASLATGNVFAQGSNIGIGNTSNGDNGFVLGVENQADSTATSSFTAGYKNHTSGANTLTAGHSNIISNANNLTVGTENAVSGTSSLVGGYKNISSGNNSIVFGEENTAFGTNSFAGGNNSKAEGRNSFAFGAHAEAITEYTIAIGSQAKTNAYDTIAIGNGAYVSGESSVVLGRTNNVTGADTVVVGANNKDISAGQSAVYGYNNKVLDGSKEQLIFGSNSQTQGQGAVVVGSHASATDIDALALGNNTIADLQNGVALGSNSVTELQVGTTNIKDNTTDIRFSNSTYAGSNPDSVVSFGTHGRAGAGGVTEYTRQLQNLAAGRVSATSTDGINGSQLYDIALEAQKHNTLVDGTNTTVTSQDNAFGRKEYKVNVNRDLTNMNSVQFGTVNDPQRNFVSKDGMHVFDGDVNTNYAPNGIKIENTDNLDTAEYNMDGININSNGKNVKFGTDGISAGDQIINNVKAGVANTDAVNVSQLKDVQSNVLNQSKSYTDSQVAKVGANAAALSALHPLDFNADEKWQFSVGFGNYKGKNATALGAFYQPNENVLLSVGTTLGTGENMVNAGATVRFGSHSSMTTNKQVAVAKEVQDLKLQLSAISQKYDNLVKNLSAQKAGQDADFEYSDLPKDHWAYDFVKKLSDKGYLNGYPDGTFKGDAKMTRYEFAAALWRAVNNGAIIDTQMAKAIKEFEPELEEVNKIMRYRIDTVAGKNNSVHKTERLRVNKNDDPFIHMKRDDYGTKTYINK